MRRPSRWSSSAHPPARITVLGGGHGMATVLRAVRDDCREVTAIVTVADDGGSSGQLRRRQEGPAVGDLRRCLIELAGEQAPLARALKRSLALNRVGTHPLGNLMIRSLADGFGDLGKASEWLGTQLGARGRVLPATAEPVCLVADTELGTVYGESAIGASPVPIRRLRFHPEQPKVPDETLQAIAEADWVLLSPGSLFTSILAVSSVPAIADALADTRAPVGWVCNLSSQAEETAGMNAREHLAALHHHRVRVDTILYDPLAELAFRPEELDGAGIEPLARRLSRCPRAVHDTRLLRSALVEVFSLS